MLREPWSLERFHFDINLQLVSEFHDAIATDPQQRTVQLCSFKRMTSQGMIVPRHLRLKREQGTGTETQRVIIEENEDEGFYELESLQVSLTQHRLLCSSR